MARARELEHRPTDKRFTIGTVFRISFEIYASRLVELLHNIEALCQSFPSHVSLLHLMCICRRHYCCNDVHSHVRVTALRVTAMRVTALSVVLLVTQSKGREARGFIIGDSRKSLR